MKNLDKFLLRRFFLPFYGFLIKFSHFIRWYQPLIFLTFIFSRKIGNWRKEKNPLPTLLALNSDRFRDDLEILARTGKYRILALSYAWQCRILFTFFTSPPTYENIWGGDSKTHTKKSGEFLKEFLPVLYKRYNIKIVLSAALHYTADYLWGAESSRQGTPYVVFHRECFHTTPERRQFWLNIWGKCSSYTFDFCIFHNETIRKNYADSGLFPLKKTASLGTLRMDDFVRRFHKNPPPLPKDKQVTLFSFHHAVGVGGAVPLWSDYDHPSGFTRMFEEVHLAFARFALEHPDVKCIIKLKWGGRWYQEIDKIFLRNGFDRKGVKNLFIDATQDIPSLIEQSSVVCGYGSTTLLESSLMRRPVVITLMGEALLQESQDKIQMKDSLEYFDVARNYGDLKDKILHNLKNPHIQPDVQAHRDALFDYWISPLRANALEGYMNSLDKFLKE